MRSLDYIRRRGLAGTRPHRYHAAVVPIYHVLRLRVPESVLFKHSQGDYTPTGRSCGHLSGEVVGDGAVRLAGGSVGRYDHLGEVVRERVTWSSRLSGLSFDSTRPQLSVLN
jgi:hypothetical protein